MQLTHAPVVLFVGNYGTGKTEVSVNFAEERHLAGWPVQIADLDLVNPYFRSREVKNIMEALGVGVVAPENELSGADLPILVPQVRGLIERPQGLTILDVGGDNVGSTVLGTLSDSLKRHPHEMWQVINGRRPLTDTVAGCVRITREIEAVARLKVTGLVDNTHLMDETDLPCLLDGLAYSKAVSQALGVPLVFVTCIAPLLTEFMRSATPCPVLSLTRRMLPPWKRREKLGPRNFLLG